MFLSPYPEHFGARVPKSETFWCLYVQNVGRFGAFSLNIGNICARLSRIQGVLMAVSQMQGVPVLMPTNPAHFGAFVPKPGALCCLYPNIWCIFVLLPPNPEPFGVFVPKPGHLGACAPERRGF